MFVRYLRSYRADTATEVIEIITSGDQLSAFRNLLEEDEDGQDLDQIGDDEHEDNAFARNSSESAKLSWFSEDPNVSIGNGTSATPTNLPTIANQFISIQFNSI
jgi:hypothetical protein